MEDAPKRANNWGYPVTRKLRWRAIARALGVPRSGIVLQAAVDRHRHKMFGNYRRPRDTLEALRVWAHDYDPPQTVTLSIGPDGLMNEEP